MPVAFGKYRLHYRLARGGMGEVYRASLVGELGFEKALVIKTILPELAAQSRFIEMFAAEAKTAVALSHGNIVPIYELGRAEDTFYIVMGYVDGPSVAQLLATHRRRGTPPPLAVTLCIMRSVLSGLAYAHSEEPERPAVVHRDITPRNVMIDRSGQVRIVDFGIAAPAHADAGVRAGSTGYVAPEQARAEAVDPRADVFSAACLLYELLTLERAFPREGIWTSPDIERVPGDLQAPLRDALAFDPVDRPADARAFLQRLGPAITAHAVTFTETDLAAHLRALYPDGQWAPQDEAPPEDVTPSTAVRPTTMTFATRLTALVDAAADDDDDDDIDVRSDAGTSVPSTSGDSRTVPPIPVAARGARPDGRRARLALTAGLLALTAGGWVWLRPTASTVPEATPAERRPPPPDLGSAPPTEPERPPPAPVTSPPPALVLHVDPPDATVRIGSQRFEGGSPFTLPLPTHGTLMAVVERPGRRPQDVELRAGEPGDRSVTLEPVARGRGYLQVLAPGVSWAEVTVDGRRRGETPLNKLELSAGAHRVVVRCVPDVCPAPELLLRRTVEITPNETLRLTAP